MGGIPAFCHVLLPLGANFLILGSRVLILDTSYLILGTLSLRIVGYLVLCTMLLKVKS